MVKTGQRRCCQGFQKLERHVATVRNPRSAFSIDSFSKTVSLVSKRNWPSPKNGNVLLLFSQLSIG